MKIFISWSGEQSRRIGKCISDWLPSMLQYVDVYFSPDSIDKGTSWFNSISTELDTTSVCLAIINSENRDNNWIHFEAGAISKGIEKSRVCPLLFGLRKEDINGPLSAFQLTDFVSTEMKLLVKSLNRVATIDRRLKDEIIEKVFDKWWPDLENEVNKVIAEVSVPKTEITKRSVPEELEEIRHLIIRLNRTSENRFKRSPELEISFRAMFDNINNLAKFYETEKDYDATLYNIIQNFKEPLLMIASETNNSKYILIAEELVKYINKLEEVPF